MKAVCIYIMSFVLNIIFDLRVLAWLPFLRQHYSPVGHCVGAFQYKHCIPVIKVRRSHDRCYPTMRISVLLSRHLYVELAPCCHYKDHYPVTPFYNTLRPRQNGSHFVDEIFRCIFLNESVWISIEISLAFVPKGPINDILALVQTMAWRRPGDKPLSESVMVNLLEHICVTRPQWIKRQ